MDDGTTSKPPRPGAPGSVRGAPKPHRVRETDREALARYRRIAENASDIIAEIDERGTFLFISPNCEKVLGYPLEGLVGRSVRDAVVSDHIHPDERDQLIDAFLRVWDSEMEGEIVYRYRHASGVFRWFASKGRSFRTPSGEWRAVVISRDVSEREDALRQLRQNDLRHRLLADATQDVLVELDAEGRVLYMSPSCEHVLGYAPDELVGTTPFAFLHPDDVEMLAERFRKRVGNDRPPRRDRIFRARTRQGSWIWMEGGGVGYQTPDGETRVVAAVRNVTDRVRAEDAHRRLEERMQQAQKLESLGMMAAGVAHDFNNLLTPILGAASLALLDLPADSAARERIAKIERAAHHASHLTRQLLEYAGIGPLDPETVEVSASVRAMGELLESAVTRRAELHYELDDDLPSVEADPAQLSQLVMSLVSNAAEAVEAGGRGPGRIVLRSGQVEADRELLGDLPTGEELPPGRYVFLEVEDDGCGMDEETRTRIFDPFFTTRRTGRGLGLAAALGILRKHRGTLQVVSEPGLGTRARVLLPSLLGGEARGSRSHAGGRGLPGGRTVLVVDDDEAVRELVAESLERAQLRVLQAEDGEEAVRIFGEQGADIDLVLLDRTMPGSNGEQVLERIRRVRNDVPVVLVSGYSEASSSQRFAGLGLAGVLQKPFLPDALVALVEDVLTRD